MADAKRFYLTVGHSNEAGLGGEGWYVRMSDSVPYGSEPQYVLASDYDALLAEQRKGWDAFYKLRASIGAEKYPEMESPVRSATSAVGREADDA